METTELVHANYPHNPGELYDCPACESTCYCEDGTCLYCQKVDEMETQNNEEQTPATAYLNLYEVVAEMADGALAQLAIMDAAMAYGSKQFRAGWDASRAYLAGGE